LPTLRSRLADELRLDVTGIDLLFDDNGLVVCEANTTPGFTWSGSCLQREYSARDCGCRDCQMARTTAQRYLELPEAAKMGHDENEERPEGDGRYHSCASTLGGLATERG